MIGPLGREPLFCSKNTCVVLVLVFVLSCFTFFTLYSNGLKNNFDQSANQMTIFAQRHQSAFQNQKDSQENDAPQFQIDSLLATSDRKFINGLITLYNKEREVFGHKENFSEWLSLRLRPKIYSTDFQDGQLLSSGDSTGAMLVPDRTGGIQTGKDLLPGRNSGTWTPATTVKEQEGTSASSQNNHVLLILASTWVDIPEKRLVQENVLRTWKLWQPLVTPILFTSDSRVKATAAKFGWKILPEPKTACSGVPIYREMFRTAMKEFPNSDFYGFVNGDLLLGNGLIPTMEAVTQWASGRNKPIMLLLRRINVDFKNKGPVSDVDNLEETALEGNPMTDGSSDGMFTNRLFPWDHVPDVVPGRLGIAMWMVSYAREMGVDVMDISDTTIAVHMTATKAGNREGWTHNNARCNHQIYDKLKIKPQSWFCGFIRCAAFKTIFVTQGSTHKVKVIDKRATNSNRCGECHMDLKPLLTKKF